MRMKTIAEIVCSACVMILATSVVAEEKAAAVVARITGQGWIAKRGSDAHVQARSGDEYSVGDVVETGPDGVMQLVFPDGACFVLGYNASARVHQYSHDESLNRRTVRIKVLKGKLRIILFKIMKDNSYVEIFTDQAVISPSMISDAVIDARSGETHVAVLNGNSGVRNVLPYVIGSTRLSMNTKIEIRSKTPPSNLEVLTVSERAAYQKEFMTYD